MKYVIESNVPFTGRVTNSKGYTDAVRALQPGQSVHLPITRNGASGIVAYLHAGGERDRKEFACRKDGDGARIWRLTPDQYGLR